MRPVLAVPVFLWYMLGCHAVVTFAVFISQSSDMDGIHNSNIAVGGGAMNTSQGTSYNDLTNLTADDAQMPPNSANHFEDLAKEEMQEAAQFGRPGFSSQSAKLPFSELGSNEANLTGEEPLNSMDGGNLASLNKTLLLSSDPYWSSLTNESDANVSNSALKKTGTYNAFENNSAFHYKIFGEEGEIKDFKILRKLASHKLLALFLCMAGVLAALLVLIYCIYNRQHKEDMFSHRRLYGEGFEDPVLHLDTPVDHFDFFSFKDTEITPNPTPHHKPHNSVIGEPKGDNRFDVPNGTSSNKQEQQNFQMGSLNIM